MNHNTTPSSMKRPKKPMPLFGLFRKNKPDPIVPHHQHQQQQQLSPLGSGISSVPFNSMLSPTFHHQQQQVDPYSPPRIPKPSVSDSRRPTRQQPAQQQPQQQPQQQQRQRTRQRSKSVGRDPSTAMLEERELALNKLCKREPPSSLADSLPLLSPTYKTTAPPVPPIPLKHQPNNNTSMRKFSSAHDLRKAAKLQQESMNQQVPLPIKHEQLSRSRSLSASPRRLHTSKSHQNLVKSPTTPTYTRSYKKSYKPSPALDSDDDDDVPLGYLQSPTSKPSSLLSDQEEDDDKDLVPIAVLDIKPTEEFQTAADKYKLKVKERLQFDDYLSGEEQDDDDDIPISLALMSPKWKKKEIKRF
ncbi:hypothetical protein MAM1_0107c05461 [Mucor ambiguus]|uniref:Uncharacterized protein n=1 Tax=Mucor ambiguus TaxID=91626 RepID=A0A0C9LV15_9FUNG|nr:hypothetical protein MAM1_0107c05461 [Mucor ambiguus]